MVRVNFAQELTRAEDALLSEGGLVGRQLDRVMRALQERDREAARRVVAEDDAVDERYLYIQATILNLLALQAPVAGDLRLVSAILHSSMHLERMGDLCVNVAKFVLSEHPYDPESPMLHRLSEMGLRAGAMLAVALDAFRGRDAVRAEELPTIDNALDRLNRGMLDDLREHAWDQRSFDWAANLILVARYLERFGDHAVDIGEQISFLVSGVFREFTDASHPQAAS